MATVFSYFLLEKFSPLHIDEANATKREFLKLNFRSGELSEITLCLERNFHDLQLDKHRATDELILPYTMPKLGVRFQKLNFMVNASKEKF